jgi:phospholipid-translocating ATPase
LHKGQTEKKRNSGGVEYPKTDSVGAEGSEDGSGKDEDGIEPRSIYVNQSLPSDAVDESGLPVTQFARNKIRTAKYTPLSFIPKNLFYQFHNIANIYFLFTIILTVS